MAIVNLGLSALAAGPGLAFSGGVLGVVVTNSITFVSPGTPGTALQLVGDSASPGASMLYGTNGSGTKGWYSIASDIATPILLTASASTSPAIQTFVTADSVNRFQLQAGGAMYWGAGGSAAVDVSLIRTGAGVLQIGGSLTLTGNLLTFGGGSALTDNGSGGLTLATAGTNQNAVIKSSGQGITTVLRTSTTSTNGLLVAASDWVNGSAGSAVRIGTTAATGNSLGSIDALQNGGTGGSPFASLALVSGGGNVLIGTTTDFGSGNGQLKVGGNNIAFGAASTIGDTGSLTFTASSSTPGVAYWTFANSQLTNSVVIGGLNGAGTTGVISLSGSMTSANVVGMDNGGSGGLRLKTITGTTIGFQVAGSNVGSIGATSLTLGVLIAQTGTGINSFGGTVANNSISVSRITTTPSTIALEAFSVPTLAFTSDTVGGTNYGQQNVNGTLVLQLWSSAVANIAATSGAGLSVGGALYVSGTTVSTSTTTGSGVFGGGVGVAGAAFIGGNTTINASLSVGGQSAGTNGLGVGGNATFAGVIGVGTVPSTTIGVLVRNGTLTGSSQFGIRSDGAFTSAATVVGAAAYAALQTAAASFTMTSGYGLWIDTPTLGSGSVVTNLYGLFIANQTGGGTNYAIKTGTGSSWFGDTVGIGVAPNAAYGLQVEPILAGTTQLGAYVFPTFSSTATNSGRTIQVGFSTAATSFTMSSGIGIYIAVPNVGAGSTVTNLYGLLVDNQSGGGTSYAIKTNAGQVQFGDVVSAGGAPNTSVGLFVQHTALTTTSQYGIVSSPTFNSSGTSNGFCVQAQVQTAAVAFNVSVAAAFHAALPVIGSGSTISNLYGLLVENVAGGSVNWAIKTGTGLVSFGDKVISTSSTGGIGYGTGAGGAVTQLTNRTTGVTINTVTGVITGSGASLGANATAEFTVTNSSVTLTDTIVITPQTGTPDTTQFHVGAVANGSFHIIALNTSSSVADTTAPVLNYAIIRASSS